MAWIKRNLFFAIGAIVAVGLLAAAGFYGYQNWQRNKAAMAALNQAYDTLRNLNIQNPSPGNSKIDNIQAARRQEQELRQWIKKAGQYFQRIPPVPDSTNGVIVDARFASARDHMLNELQSEAANASVSLPPQYSFSFDAERALVKFAPSGLPALAQQLGEVRTICGILFAAKINFLDGIRRVPVSADDVGGPPSDYLNGTAVTNSLAIFTPYEVTFRCFSQNLSKVLTSLATSPDGFVVTGINVQPAAAAANELSPSGGPGGLGQQSPAGYPQRRYYNPAPALKRNGGLQTVLNEQLLSITMDIEIVKLLPRK